MPVKPFAGVKKAEKRRTFSFLRPFLEISQAKPSFSYTRRQEDRQGRKTSLDSEKLESKTLVFL